MLNIINKNNLFLAIFLFVFSADFSCAQDQEKNKLEEIRVTLNIYSGEPNPSWTLNDPNEIDQIKTLVLSLPQTEPIEEKEFGAFFVDIDSISNFPEVIFVFDNIVKTTDPDGTVKWFKDENEELIDFLIERTNTELGSEADLFEDDFEADTQ